MKEIKFYKIKHKNGGKPRIVSVAEWQEIIQRSQGYSILERLEEMPKEMQVAKLEVKQVSNAKPIVSTEEK